MKRRHIALTALILLASMTLSSCAAGVLPAPTVPEPAATTEMTVYEKAAKTTPENISAGKMKPGGKLITVLNESFNGFTDLTYEINGVLKTSPGKEAVTELVKCGAIAQKLNPNDPQGKFYPDQTVKAAEAITLAVNAFSANKILLDNWYSSINARVNEDDYPDNFKNLVFKNKTDYLSEDITIYEFSLMLLYTFEKNTGIFLEPVHNLDKLTGMEAYQILRANNVLNYGESPDNNLLVRYQAAEHIYNLLKYTNS